MTVGRRTITRQGTYACNRTRLGLHIRVGKSAAHTFLQGTVNTGNRHGGNQVRIDMVVGIGIEFTGSYGKIKGSSDNVKTYYPDMAQEKFEFNNNLVDISAVYEYNFWPYGTGRDYRGAKRLTPFVFGGIGVTYAEGGDNSVITGNIPLGLGVKYKVADRWNLGVEWTMHFSLTDKLDNVKDPYMVSSSGAFKNTDCYSHLLVTLTYSFLAKCRTCHNADE